jgi:uncharacterized membrane protein
MKLLITGLILFFATHSISIVNNPWRKRMVAKRGEWSWKGMYSLVAIIGIVLIVKGYGLARLEPLLLYTSPSWLRHVAMVLLLPVFPLLLAAYLPGRIQRTVKHPMITAVALWAVAHLMVNGTLADILLFGTFLVWAIVDRISLQYREALPAPSAPTTVINDVLVIILGIAIYGAFVLWLHALLIGVAII